MESNALLSSPWFLLTIITVILSAIWILASRTWTRVNLPPGPASWPLIGTIPTLVSSKLSPLNLLTAFAEKYGDIYRLRIFTTDIVILNSYELIKDAFQNPNIQDRPRIVPIEDFFDRRNIGIAGSSGKVWKDHRLFVHSALRKLNSGPRTIDDIIHAEAHTLLGEVAKILDRPLNPHKLFNCAVSNVISVLLFGRSFSYTEPAFNQLQEIINENLKLAASGGIFIFIPILAKVPFSPANKIKKGVENFTRVIEKIVDEHRNQPDEPKNPQDFIDLYLSEIQRTSQDSSSSFDEVNLKVCIGDMFGASTETTNASLKWSILYMVAHPDVQTRVQDELDRVVGRDRLPTLSDRPSLPFTEATLQEIRRMGLASPLGVAHRCGADTKVDGYDIRAGTLVVSNMWRVARDSRVWDIPDEFRPERFLSDSGECIKPEELIPFCTGKRICIGESIARKQMFVFFTNLLHRFTFRRVEESSSPLSLEGRLGFVYDTPVFQVRVCARTM
ncbi:cytochrome P450 2U1-like [Diadema antillarum]|uniref:cytochrome P450 2U1-like n=1 Tax=Diadema antillarum TaxID=105358 RepID=UPI003A8BB1A1